MWGRNLVHFEQWALIHLGLRRSGSFDLANTPLKNLIDSTIDPGVQGKTTGGWGDWMARGAAGNGLSGGAGHLRAVHRQGYADHAGFNVGVAAGAEEEEEFMHCARLNKFSRATRRAGAEEAGWGARY